MKIIVQYSGGKDSQATLIWASKKYGSQNISAVFCDTKWENPVTYNHIKTTSLQLGVQTVELTSTKYNGMVGLITDKKRFPSTKARFCTQELKVIPFIDYLLDEIKDNVLIIQGIRKDESIARIKMNESCRLFKFYLEPYKIDEKGVKKYHTYRKIEVLEFISKYDDSILRPVFNWTAQEVIDYIILNEQKPNKLYYQGFSRVGCFPCIMCNHVEIKQIIRYYPETLQEIIALEENFNTSFFPPNYIPDKFSSKEAVVKKGKNKGKIVKYPTTQDVIKYINGKFATIDLFDPEEERSCMSYYSICE